MYPTPVFLLFIFRPSLQAHEDTPVTEVQNFLQAASLSDDSLCVSLPVYLLYMYYIMHCTCTCVQHTQHEQKSVFNLMSFIKSSL